MSRCPTCGATSASGDRFCEVDGTELVADAAAEAAARCPACGEGTVEADGYCSSCGRRITTTVPPTLPPGTPLGGGTVVRSRSAEEHRVRLGEREVLVVLGDEASLGREAEALGRLAPGGAFPPAVARGNDPRHGPFLALGLAEGVPLADTARSADMRFVASLLRRVVAAADAVEGLGLEWTPQRDDVVVAADGTVRLQRLRVARRLGPGERLDVRSVVEAVGPTFVPRPALEGPSRAFRLLLPHVTVPGDRGTTAQDVLAEVAAIEAELSLPTEDGSRIAGVCDPGLRRPHNEDAMASARGVTRGEPWSVLVVCDGVSSSTDADQASAVASKTACDALAHFARTGDVAFEAGATAVAAAIRAAHVAVCAQALDSTAAEPPGTTIVVGLLWRRRLTVGWVGDSRAYWISDQGSELLTHDHSWANEAIARGEVTEAEAAVSPLAHALTRCLGPLETADADAPRGEARRRIQEVVPEVRARDLPGPGWIVLCSDGFWNYFPRAEDVASLVRAVGVPATSAMVARRLANEALAHGGQDNTTVLVHQHR